MGIFDNEDGGPDWWDKVVRFVNQRNYTGAPGESEADVRNMQDARSSGLSQGLISAGANIMAAYSPGVGGAQRGQFLAQAAQAPAIFGQSVKDARAEQVQNAQVAKLKTDTARRDALSRFVRETMGGGGGSTDMPAMTDASSGGYGGSTVGSGPAPVSGTPPSGQDNGYVRAVVAREVSPTGGPAQQNPNSTARGNGQFTAPTWLGLMRQEKPALIAGKSDAEILAMRDDPNLSAEMIAANGRRNAQSLQAAGLPATPGNVLLAHAVGPGGAQAVLRASPDTPLSALLTPDAIKFNAGNVNGLRMPFAQMTAGDLQSDMNARVARTQAPAPGAAPPAAGMQASADPAAPRTVLASGPAQAPQAAPQQAGSGGLRGMIQSLDPQSRMLVASDPEKYLPEVFKAALARESVRVMSPQEVARIGLPSGSVATLNMRTNAPSVLYTPPNPQTFGTPGGGTAILERNPDGSPRVQQVQAPNTRRDLTPQEVQSLGLPQGQVYQRDSLGALYDVGGNRVSVNVNTGETSQRRINEARSAFEAKRSALGDLAGIEDLAYAGVRTGPVEDWTQGLRGLAVNLGIASRDDVQNYTQQRLLGALSQRLSVASLPPGPASDRDVQLALRTAPGTSDNPESLLLKAATMRQALRYEEDRVNAMEAYASQRGPDGNSRGTVGFDDAWRRERPDVIPRVPRDVDISRLAPGSVVRLTGIRPEEQHNFPHYPYLIVPDRN